MPSWSPSVRMGFLGVSHPKFSLPFFPRFGPSAVNRGRKWGEKRPILGPRNPEAKLHFFWRMRSNGGEIGQKMGRNGAKISFFNMIKKYHFFFLGGNRQNSTFSPSNIRRFWAKIGGNWGKFGWKKHFFSAFTKNAHFRAIFCRDSGEIWGKMEVFGVHPSPNPPILIIWRKKLSEFGAILGKKWPFWRNDSKFAQFLPNSPRFGPKAIKKKKQFWPKHQKIRFSAHFVPIFRRFSPKFCPKTPSKNGHFGVIPQKMVFSPIFSPKSFYGFRELGEKWVKMTEIGAILGGNQWKWWFLAAFTKNPLFSPNFRPISVQFSAVFQPTFGANFFFL